MVNDAKKTASPNDTGTWGGPRVPNWSTQGKRAVMHLHPSVFSFVDMVCRGTKRTKRTLLIQIFLEGLRSTFGVTADDLLKNEYSTTARTAQRPVTTVESLREWANDTVVATPYDWDKHVADEA